MRRNCILSLFLIAASAQFAPGQDHTFGLFLNNAAKASPGYLLLPPIHNGYTYLIDNNGQVVHSWNGGNSEPGRMAYLLTNGHLLRSDSLPGQGPPIGGGDGGRFREFDWDGNVLWTYQYATSTYALHHDFKRLPNGNIIALMVEVKSPAQMAAAGFRPDILQPGGDGNLAPDAVVEIQPIYPSGGQIVWEWHVWDHLVQSYDSAKSNYGTPAAHPELVDPNSSYPTKIAAFWNHMNGIDYNADLDQIMLSVRGNSEVWIIDHSTTKAEAASHSGGRYGNGGDLLYRWGNPSMYGAGKAADEIFYQQHDTQWVAKGLPGAGNVLIMNNGVKRPAGNYSSVDEFVPSVDSNGNYSPAGGSAYAPQKLAWTYAGSGTEQYYEPDIAGAERMANGNTLICYGTHGVIEEVTSAGEIVWKYVNPVVQTGPLAQGQTPSLDAKNENMNSVFKVRKYAPDFPGLVGRDLTPKGPLEKYSITYVNGAALQAGPGAPGAIMSVTGSGLADGAAASMTTPPPTTLAGTTVQITDSTGATISCPLLFASASQLNLLVPTECAKGAATVTIRRGAASTAWVSASIESVAPGLFSINGTGKGVGSIQAQRVDAGGVRSDVPVFSYSASAKQFVSTPIDLGAATDQLYLTLYGTGIRGYSSLSAISAAIGGVAAPVVSASAYAQFPGLDYVTVGPLPRTLAGKGESNIVLTVDGRTANTVTVNIK